MKTLSGELTLCLVMCVLPVIIAQQSVKYRYNLAIIILDNVTPSSIKAAYQTAADCTVHHQLQSDDLELGVDLININKDTLSPQGVLNAVCNLEEEISTVILTLPKSNSYQYLPIYKYTLNFISSHGIPIIVWNSYMPRSSVFNTVVHIGPQYQQQAEAYMTLLRYYKWDKFSILTTLCPGYVQFTSAIRRLVHDLTNEKGEQIMQILSSHTIRNVNGDNGGDIVNTLMAVKASDTRVILLHMSERELVLVMNQTKRFSMTTKEYMWLGTTQTYTLGLRNTQELPLGMIALKYEGYHDEEDVAKAMLTTSDLWKESIIKYHDTTNYNESDKPNKISCDGSSSHFWKHGQALYNSMIGYKSDSKDIEGCTGNKYMPTRAMDIDNNGLNQKTSLMFVNLAYRKRARSSRGPKQEKYWKEIGKWHAPNITELDDITWPGNSPKPPEGKPARSFLRVVTHSEPPYVIFTDPDPITGNCDAIGSVRVSLDQENKGKEGYTNKTLFQCATGLCIDLLNKLKEDMQFDYELMQARDNQWGNYVDDSKTEWNGLVRDLMDGIADMSMTSLKIGPERNAAIDFSIPFIETGITIIVLIKKGVISATAFLEPYQYIVWFIVCSGMTFGTCLIIFFFEWGSPKGIVRLHRKATPKEPYDVATWGMILVVAVHLTGFFILLYDFLGPAAKERYKGRSGERFSLARSLWLIWTILFGAAVETDSAKGLASRFLTAIWSLFSLVFLASYTANLAAFMITKEEFFELKGINDERLREPHSQSPPFRFGTVPDGSTALNLKKNHPEMYRYMENYNQAKVKDGILAVKNNELQAFIYDATVLEYQASRDDNCTLTTVGSWYAMTGYGIGFPKGSKWKQKFDVHLTRYVNEGEMDRLRKFWLTGACKKSAGKGRESSHSLDIVNFTSAYILLIVGVGLAILLLLAEHIYFTFCRRKLRKIDNCGCCALISLSMGESLSFEESVMEVIESTMNRICHNDFCRANQQRLSHELDMAICRLSMLQATIQNRGSHLQLRDPPDGAEKSSHVQPPVKIWSKSARFEEADTDTGIAIPDSPSTVTRRRKDPELVASRECLEAVESCL